MSCGCSKGESLLLQVSSTLNTAPLSFDRRDPDTLPNVLKTALKELFGTAKIPCSQGWTVRLKGVYVRYNGVVQTIVSARESGGPILYAHTATGERPIPGVSTTLPDRVYITATQDGNASLHLLIIPPARSACGC